MTKSVVHNLDFGGQPTSAATRRFGYGCLIGAAGVQNNDLRSSDVLKNSRRIRKIE
jgi:hypothetical protein